MPELTKKAPAKNFLNSLLRHAKYNAGGQKITKATIINGAMIVTYTKNRL